MSRNWTRTDLAIYNLKRTPPEKRQAATDAKAEKELHRIVVQWLHLQGIKAIVHSRTDKRTTQACGVFDLLLAVRGLAVAIELKVGGNKLSEAQRLWQADAATDGWITGVAYSLDEAKAIYQRACDQTRLIS